MIILHGVACGIHVRPGGIDEGLVTSGAHWQSDGGFHGKVVVMAVEGNQREDYKMYCICVGEC